MSLTGPSETQQKLPKIQESDVTLSEKNNNIGGMDEVVYKKLSKFKTKLTKQLKAPDNVDSSFEQRISAIFSTSTHCGAVHKIWLTLNEEEMLKGADEKSMLLLLKQTSEFRGNAIPREEIKKEFACDMEGFYVFSLLQDEGANKPNFELRVSLDGRVGEITWIESNATVKGNDLFKVFELISDFLKIDNVILRDAAKDNQGLPLRVLRPLIKSDKKTWYQSKNFEVYDCNEVKVLGEKKYFQQSKAIFSKAIKTLRRFKLKNVYPLFYTKKDETKCKRIIKRSLSSNSKENIENADLSQLLESVFSKSISGERGCKTAQKDLKFLYDNLLNPEWYRQKEPKLEEASITLHQTGLFIRSKSRC